MTPTELADEIEREGIERVVYNKDITTMRQINEILIAALRALAVPTCPECKGSGDVKRMTQQHGPDDYEVEVECPTCHGTGTQPPAVPEGVVRVPVEPTPAMIEAICSVHGNATCPPSHAEDERHKEQRRRYGELTYRAMLAAAPDAKAT
jgi:hypothetical protein